MVAHIVAQHSATPEPVELNHDTSPDLYSHCSSCQKIKWLRSFSLYLEAFYPINCMKEIKLKNAHTFQRLILSFTDDTTPKSYMTYQKLGFSWASTGLAFWIVEHGI